VSIFGRLLGRKASATTRAIVEPISRQVVWTPRDYANLAKEGYQQNAVVYACVNMIANAVAGVPTVLYSDEAREKEVLRHPLLRLLARPNPAQGKAQFLRSVTTNLMLSGNAYVERVGPDNKPPLEMYALRPDRVKVKVGDSVTPVAGYEYTVSGEPVVLPPERVLHLKLTHPLSDWYGMSPLEAAARSVDQNNDSKTWNVALLQNAARPPGAFVSTDPLTDEQFQRMRTLIEEKYSGGRNAGRPLLLEGGITWQELGLSPLDMAWEAGQKLSAREIAVALGVPPQLIGIPDSQTYANYQEARKALYEETILPLLGLIYGELDSWLPPLYQSAERKEGDRLSVWYDADEIEALQEDRQKVWERAIKAKQAGVLTANEARAALGYEERPEGDKLQEQTVQAPKGGEDDKPEAKPAE
jgi:HK97 family phage portal protein